MNIRKIIVNTVVIVIAFLLFIIWYQIKFKNSVIPVSTAKSSSIYLITVDNTTQFWHILNQGVSDMAGLTGIPYVWNAPPKRNTAEQINIIKNAIKNRADALIIAASEPIKVSSAIEDAKALGIKIIYVDAPASEEGIVTLATDNYGAGLTAGQNMIQELKSIGIRSGSIGILGIAPETITTSERDKGFRNAIEEDGSYKLLDTKYTNDVTEVAQEAAEAFIAENADLVGLFATNENNSVSIGNVIQESKKNIVGIGFDINPQIQKLINSGSLKAVMVQNPYTMGYLGMAETIAALNGKDTGPSFINTGVSVRNKYTH